MVLSRRVWLEHMDISSHIFGSHFLGNIRFLMGGRSAGVGEDGFTSLVLPLPLLMVMVIFVSSITSVYARFLALSNGFPSQRRSPQTRSRFHTVAWQIEVVPA